MSKTGKPRSYSLAKYQREADSAAPFPVDLGDREVALRQPTVEELKLFATLDFEGVIRLLADTGEDAEALIEAFNPLPAAAGQALMRDYREHFSLGG